MRVRIQRLLGRLCTRLVPAWVALAAIAAAPAAFPQDLGAEYKGWTVADFEIAGLGDDLAGRLENGLALTGHGTWVWTERPLYAPDLLQKDMQRARLFLARNGYPYASLDARFGADVEHREVKVTLEVTCGPAVLVAANEVHAIPPALEPKAAEILKLDIHEIFSDDRVGSRVRRLLSILQEGGYALARVTSRVGWDDSTHVRVDFTVVAGHMYWFGRTIVQGVDHDLIRVVRGTVDIDPGTRYDPKDIARATESLRVLGLFRRVEVRTRPAGGDTLDIVADLAERRPRSVEVGLGYWSEDQLRARVLWLHRNLLAEGRGGSIEGEYSRFEQRVTLSLWKPVLWRTRTRGQLRLGERRQSEISYTALVSEAEISATYLYSLRTTLRPALSVTYTDIESKTTANRAFLQSGVGAFAWLSFGWTHDTLDDKLYPTSGSYARFDGEWGLPAVLSNSHYLLGDVEATHYEDRLAPFILVTRSRVSVGAPLDGTVDLLPNKRFYAGGTTSMRGFRRHRLGPLDSEGVPLGGQARLEFTVEVRRPIWGRLIGAVFVDSGQVWSRRHQVQLSDLAFAVGPGLIVRTPLGPVRADLGIRLTSHQPDQPRTVFHLSVGHMF